MPRGWHVHRLVGLALSLCLLAGTVTLASAATGTKTVVAHVKTPEKGAGVFYEITAKAKEKPGKTPTAGDVTVTIHNQDQLPANIRAAYRVEPPARVANGWKITIIVAINYPTTLAESAGSVSVEEEDASATLWATIFGFPEWYRGSVIVHKESCSTAQQQAAAGGFARTVGGKGPTAGSKVAQFAAQHCK